MVIAIDVNLLFGGSVSAPRGSIPPAAALSLAEKTKDSQIARLEKDPVVARELAAFRKALERADSPEDLLKDFNARKVLLGGYGLGDQVNNTALVTKILTSDPFDPNGLANRFEALDANWKRLNRDLDFFWGGLTKINIDKEREKFEAAYIEGRWRAEQDAQAPGLGAALLFKQRASSFDSVFELLGDRVGREVATRALSLPQELAFQSLEAQADAVERRLDVSRLKDQRFVDQFVQRYLAIVSTTGVNPGIVA